MNNKTTKKSVNPTTATPNVTFEKLEKMALYIDELGVDLSEPFDPAYVSDEEFELSPIKGDEKSLLRKLNTCVKALRKANLNFVYEPYRHCFRVERYFNSDYPTYMYVYVNMDEGDYSFGTEDEDLVYDKKASVVVEAARKWVNATLVSTTKYIINGVEKTYEQFKRACKRHGSDYEIKKGKKGTTIIMNH